MTNYVIAIDINNGMVKNFKGGNWGREIETSFTYWNLFNLAPIKPYKFKSVGVGVFFFK